MKALFLDRDGVINIDFGYVGDKSRFVFVDGIKDVLREFQNRGYTLFIVTNQSGIARGYYSEDEFLTLMEWMIDELKKDGIFIKDFRYCPHHPDFTGECDCRKPKPGMILDLAKRYKIDLKNSVLIGDKESDILAGKRAGVGKNILFKGVNELLKEIKCIK